MKFLLDTDTCIAFLRHANPAVVQRLDALGEHDVGLSSVVLAALLFGAERSAKPAEGRERVLELAGRMATIPFDDRAADHYARIRARLGALGTPIGANAPTTC